MSTTPTSEASQGGGGGENMRFLGIIFFLDFPPEEDILRQKCIRLKIFSIKFSTKKILIVVSSGRRRFATTMHQTKNILHKILYKKESHSRSC